MKGLGQQRRPRSRTASAGYFAPPKSASGKGKEKLVEGRLRGAMGPCAVLQAVRRRCCRRGMLSSSLTALAYWRLRVRHAGPRARAWQ